MSVILIMLPLLSVEASVKGNSEKLQFDLSNGVVEDGYFRLPIDKSSDGLIFNLSYTAGYIDEESKDFIGIATCVLSSKEWRANQMVNVPLNTKIVKVNNVTMASFLDQYHQEYYDVPVQLNGKEITLVFQFNEGKGTIAHSIDREGNEVTLKNGDVLFPIYTRYTTGISEVDVVQEDKKIIYDDKLFAVIAPADFDTPAFRINGQSTHAGGHAKSNVIIPTNSSPSEWAKAEVDKANKNGLTTERVLKDFQNTITREEFCELTILLYEKLSGKTAELVSPNPFKDTDNISVLKAYKLGIVNGTGNGQFSPDKPLNREQMAKMFYYTLQLARPDIAEAKEELSFTDKNTISQWAVQAVKFMYKEKIILGSNNKFSPQKAASREEAIALVNRVFEKFSK